MKYIDISIEDREDIPPDILATEVVSPIESMPDEELLDLLLDKNSGNAVERSLGLIAEAARRWIVERRSS